ncbi:MAG: hypothetical protein WC342_10685 [Methanoregula sp.]|jgi:hypothetical protein
MQKCRVCDHKNRDQIEKMLLSSGTSGTVNGVSLRDIQKMFKIPKSSLLRHKENHLKPGVLCAVERAEDNRLVRIADNTLDQVKDLNQQTCNILAACLSDGDRKNALAAVREARGLIETQAKLLGQFSPSTAVQVNVGTPSLVTSPEWSILMRVLARHPEVNAELTTALSAAGL